MPAPKRAKGQSPLEIFKNHWMRQNSKYINKASWDECKRLFDELPEERKEEYRVQSQLSKRFRHVPSVSFSVWHKQKHQQHQQMLWWQLQLLRSQHPWLQRTSAKSKAKAKAKMKTILTV